MKNKTWIMILSAVLIVCVGLSIWLMMPGEDASAAEIWLDGEIYKTVSLSRNQEFVVQGVHGSATVAVWTGKIAVTAADCPDHYCMDRGYCAGGTQIVCLPNRLVIKFTGEQEIDGAVG